MKCDDDSPCNSCRKFTSRGKLFGQPCLKAHFLEIIENAPYGLYHHGRTLSWDTVYTIMPRSTTYRMLLSASEEQIFKLAWDLYDAPLWPHYSSQVRQWLLDLEEHLELTEHIDMVKLFSSVFFTPVESCPGDLIVDEYLPVRILCGVSLNQESNANGTRG